MKRDAFILFTFWGIQPIVQNVGINSTGSSPDPSAGVDIGFTNKGLLLPGIAHSARLYYKIRCSIYGKNNH